MKTLKARFEEKFPKQKLFVRENSNEFSNLKSTEELLTFIKQELMLLAEEITKNGLKEHSVDYLRASSYAATIIRTRADEI